MTTLAFLLLVYVALCVAACAIYIGLALLDRWRIRRSKRNSLLEEARDYSSPFEASTIL